MDFEWTSQLPEIVERTGHVHDFHMVGQWFPKIARREPNGAWAHFPFNAQSDSTPTSVSYDVVADVRPNGRRRDGSAHRRRRRSPVAAGCAIAQMTSMISRGRLGRVSASATNPWTASTSASCIPPEMRGTRTSRPPRSRRPSFYGAAFGRYPYPGSPWFTPRHGRRRRPAWNTRG